MFNVEKSRLKYSERDCSLPYYSKERKKEREKKQVCVRERCLKWWREGGNWVDSGKRRGGYWVRRERESEGVGEQGGANLAL